MHGCVSFGDILLYFCLSARGSGALKKQKSEGEEGRKRWYNEGRKKVVKTKKVEGSKDIKSRQSGFPGSGLK